MKYIIAGTDRKNSRSMELSKWIQNRYQEQGEKTEIIDLCEVGLQGITNPYGEERPEKLVSAVAKTLKASGLIMVVPEYNGSYPGALKYFIDHWAYPDSFEFRPVSFVGLGGRWGGLRPVEHLQGVFGYRNAFVYPERVFVSNVWSVLKDGEVADEEVEKLLMTQIKGFQKFVKALDEAGLSANARGES